MGMGQGQMGWCPCVRFRYLVNGLIILGWISWKLHYLHEDSGEVQGRESLVKVVAAAQIMYGHDERDKTCSEERKDSFVTALE